MAAGAFAAGQTGGVQSFNNDGYSETRTTSTESKAALRGLLGPLPDPAGQPAGGHGLRLGIRRCTDAWL